MANKFNNPSLINDAGGAKKLARGPKEKSFSPDPEKTANWPSVPGPTQPGTRDKAGTKKIKIHPKSEGI